jgi:CheY-like chemotaxis protein
VLLVEDHHETAIILAKLLQRCGHVVRIAGTIASALHQASVETFDCVISDIGLPDGTGHDLMRQIKQKYGIPGVALTGYGMEDDLARSREVGFAEHVVKPVNLAQLETVIRRIVER